MKGRVRTKQKIVKNYIFWITIIYYIINKKFPPSFLKAKFSSLFNDD